MKKIIIKTQEEWDSLEKVFNEKTVVIFQDARIDELYNNYNNCTIELHGSSRVDSMSGSSRVDYMSGSSRVDSMSGSSRVDYMSGSSRVDYMYDSSRVSSMSGSSRVDSMSGSSRVDYMSGSSRVDSMSDSSRVSSMSGSSRVDSMSGSSRVDSMSGSSRVGSMYDSSRVDYMSGSSRVDSMSGSSRVDYMYGSSRVDYMSGSSRVSFMYDSSRVDSMSGSSRVSSMSGSSRVGSMYDSSRVDKAFDGAVIFTNDKRVGFADSGVTIKRMDIKSSFETMLKHGVLRADGITKKFKKVKNVDTETKVYFLEDDTFCARSGDTFAHAKALKMAVLDLRFKLSDRDKSQYENMTLADKLTLEEAVTCYRVITGACSGGVEDFLEKNKVGDRLTIQEIINLTEGAYGGETFAGFFNGDIED